MKLDTKSIYYLIVIFTILFIVPAVSMIKITKGNDLFQVVFVAFGIGLFLLVLLAIPAFIVTSNDKNIKSEKISSTEVDSEKVEIRFIDEFIENLFSYFIILIIVAGIMLAIGKIL